MPLPTLLPRRLVRLLTPLRKPLAMLLTLPRRKALRLLRL